MKCYRITLSFMLLASFFFLSACATKNRSYWVREELVEGIDSDADDWAIIPSEIDDLPKDGVDYKRFREVREKQLAGDLEDYYKNLRIIEYDDYGDKWESRQTQSAIDLINRSVPTTDVIVFCHGWRNNAKPDNGDLRDFNRFMRRFGTGVNKDAVGIYIGWRGASVRTDHDVKIVNNVANIPATLTFMARRAATSRIAGIPLESDLWKIRKAAIERGCRVTLIGHSFGARVLERVVSPSIVSADAQKEYFSDLTREGEFSVRKKLQIADLVVLVNPATEALHTRNMMIALQDWDPDTPPAVISLLSDSDNANRWIWKTGKTADRLFTSTVPIQDRKYKLGHHIKENLFSPLKTERQWSYVNSTPGANDNLVVGKIKLTPENQGWNIEPANSNSKSLSAKGFVTLRLEEEILDGHTGRDENVGIFTKNLERVVLEIFHSCSDSKIYKASKLHQAISSYESKRVIDGS